ncbi:MAG: 1,4-dihydroxy-2-naphthoate octaprenyltransferase [Dehalococcoidia bacterium]
MNAAQPTPPALSKRRAWWLAARPFSLPASIVPVLVGSAAAADEEFRPLLFVLVLAGSLLIHAATNFATDFFDFVDGIQPGATLGGVIRGGLLKAEDVHRASIATFAAGSLCGLVIVAVVGWPILAVGLASVLAGYFYTASPIKYGRRGLGEVMVFLFMGTLMVMASSYVQVEAWTSRSFYASLPVGLLVANILHANNLRDIVNDRARKKVTIATLIDRPAADVLLYALVIGAFAVVAVCVALGAMPLSCLLVLLAVPSARGHLRALAAREAAALNPLVRTAARLHLHFGLLLAVGYLIDAIA